MERKTIKANTKERRVTDTTRMTMTYPRTAKMTVLTETIPEGPGPVPLQGKANTKIAKLIDTQAKEEDDALSKIQAPIQR